MTPYFLFDLKQLKNNLLFHQKTTKDLGVELLYSIKTLSHIEVLKEVAKYVTGFSVSSLFEAKLAHYISKNQHTIHFVSPGINTSQWPGLSQTVHYVTFNSLEQFIRFQDKLNQTGVGQAESASQTLPFEISSTCEMFPSCDKDHQHEFSKKTSILPKISYGLRVNPEISFVKDNRYDPCKKFSKLGVPLPDILPFLKDKSKTKHLQGLHFHNNCDSQDFSQLEKTFLKIESILKQYLHQFKWINLGGGYVFDSSDKIKEFYSLIQYIKKTYNFEHIIIEPGSSILQNSVHLVSSVIDIFKREGKNIAVLDTTVNHLPEVFEYQYQPDILKSDVSGPVEYLLAGCSCLAGDIFGTYRFKKKLDIGTKITFKNVGSYSLVKANMFNGINLPDIYCQKERSMLEKIKTYTFKDYINYWGG